MTLDSPTAQEIGDEAEQTARTEAVVRRFAQEAIGEGEVASIAHVLHPDFAASIPISVEPVRGPEGYRRLLKGFGRACPDGLKFALHDLFAVGERAVFRFTARAKHTGSLFGVPPTSEPLEMGEIHVLRLKEGLIIEDVVADTTPDLPRLLGRRPDILAQPDTDT
jgi:predicted ester cyclase